MRVAVAGTVAALLLGVAGLARADFEARRVRGEVEVKRAGAASWAQLAAGDEVGRGDEVRTGPEGRLELSAADGSVLRLAPRSRLEVSRIQVREGERDVGLRLRLGRLWAEVAEALGGDSRFEVETANAVAGVRGTAFAVLANADRSALVRVYTGTVGVKGKRKKGGPGRPRGARKRVPGPSRISQAEWEEVVAAAMMQVKISALGDISPAETFEDAGDAPAWAAWDDDAP